MTCFGIYSSILMFLNWQDNQVLTTIQTTANSVKNVQFPSVTFCTSGHSQLILNATIIKMFQDFLKKTYGIEPMASPLHLAELKNVGSL